MYLYFEGNITKLTLSGIGPDASGVGQKTTHLHGQQHDVMNITLAILDTVHGRTRIICRGCGAFSHRVGGSGRAGGDRRG